MSADFLEPLPVGVGAFPPMKTGDIEDLAISVAAELESGETVADAQVRVVDLDGNPVESAVAETSVTATGVTFRIQAPTPGLYKVVATFGISDGRRLTRTAMLPVV